MIVSKNLNIQKINQFILGTIFLFSFALHFQINKSGSFLKNNVSWLCVNHSSYYIIQGSHFSILHNIFTTLWCSILNSNFVFNETIIMNGKPIIPIRGEGTNHYHLYWFFLYHFHFLTNWSVIKTSDLNAAIYDQTLKGKVSL